MHEEDFSFEKQPSKEKIMKEKEFDYKKVAKEIGWSFSKAERITEKKTDYDYYKAVMGEISPETVMLDIGSGSAEKSLKFFAGAKKVYAIDREIEMLKKAKSNAENLYGKDFEKWEFLLVDGNGELGFDDELFDLVVSRHCGANMSEVFRVLKNGGVFISEDVADDDCLELKKLFGRGQRFGEKVPLEKEIFEECKKAGFSKIELLRFEEHEFYKSRADFEYLLSRTPILNVYDKDVDGKILDEYIRENKTEKGILLKRRLFAFRLQK